MIKYLERLFIYVDDIASIYTFPVYTLLQVLNM